MASSLLRHITELNLVWSEPHQEELFVLVDRMAAVVASRRPLQRRYHSWLVCCMSTPLLSVDVSVVGDKKVFREHIVYLHIHTHTCTQLVCMWERGTW